MPSLLAPCTPTPSADTWKMKALTELSPNRLRHSPPGFQTCHLDYVSRHMSCIFLLLSLPHQHFHSKCNATTNLVAEYFFLFVPWIFCGNEIRSAVFKRWQLSLRTWVLESELGLLMRCICWQTHSSLNSLLLQRANHLSDERVHLKTRAFFVGWLFFKEKEPPSGPCDSMQVTADRGDRPEIERWKRLCSDGSRAIAASISPGLGAFPDLSAVIKNV